MKEIIINDIKLYSKTEITDKGNVELFNSETDKIYYSGGILNGKFCGKGKLKTKNFIYNGDFCDGKMSGEGIYHVKNTSVYNGQMKENKYNGKGNFVSHFKKFIYEGDFIDGTFEGKGSLIIKNKDSIIKYNGAFKNGFFDGKGELTCELDEIDKLIISGNFDEGIENGEMKIEYMTRKNMDGDNFEYIHDMNVTLIKKSKIIEKIIAPENLPKNILCGIHKKICRMNFDQIYNKDINGNLTKNLTKFKKNITEYYLGQFRLYMEIKKQINFSITNVQNTNLNDSIDNSTQNVNTNIIINVENILNNYINELGELKNQITNLNKKINSLNEFDEDVTIIDMTEKNKLRVDNNFCIYSGCLDDEFKMHGYGIIQYKKKIGMFNYGNKKYEIKSYEGTFENGNINGKGILTIESKIRIMGTFKISNLMDDGHFELICVD